MNTTRRTFLTGLGASTLATQLPAQTSPAPFRVAKVGATFEREKLIKPFGFKGGYLSELWQTVARVEDDQGNAGVGLGTQSVLWSDASIFKAHSEAGGNALMFLLLEHALQWTKTATVTSPIDLLEALLPDVYAYGQKITNNPNLRKTFVLNALVPLDNAIWLMYARRRGISTFDNLVEGVEPVLSHRHKKVARVPLISYGVSIKDVVAMVDDGHFFLKIKIGQPGSQEEMLTKDKARLSAIHQAIGHKETPHTKDGRIPYYFDANGRYLRKDTLNRLLDHAQKIGARDRIVLLEEPFPEQADIDVRDLGVRVAADESAHTEADVLLRQQMGYGAIAVKGIAKTLSMTLKILQAARKHGLPCFCADLTVPPILIDWHKNLAARMAPLPELTVGLLETNAHQNYAGWDRLRSYHPAQDAPWTQAKKGIFHLDDDFYKRSGGIFLRSNHYENLFPKTD